MSNPRIRLASSILSSSFSEAHDYRIIDIGARDCGLKSLLPAHCNYLSIDLVQNSKQSIDIVADASSLDYSFVRSNDLIVGLDVLEHIDDLHSLLHKFFKLPSQRFLFCLPCTSHWKYRLKYALNGKPPGGKYNIYSTTKVLDRHRWLSPYKDSLDMMKD